MAIDAEYLLEYNKCCFKKYTVDVLDVYAKRKNFQSRSQQDKRAWLGVVLDSTSLSTMNPHNAPLCRNCFCRYHGVKRGLMYTILKKIKNNTIGFEHGKTHKSKIRPLQHLSLAWCSQYARHYGDVMPDSGEVHLPSYSWKLIHHAMERDVSSTNADVPLYGSFLRVLKSELPHVKVRACKRFGKCLDCANIDEKINKSDGLTREFWRAQKQHHNTWQMKERRKYYDHQVKSLDVETRHRSLTLSIDNMDQSKSNLPSMRRPDKALEKHLPLKVHITGVMIHGMDRTEPMVFTWYDRFPASSNVICTVLWETLSKLSENGTKSFPPVLNLHLDNCWRENKNKYVFGFLKALVTLGYFKKIKVGFKPVGHTHDLPDQMFSVFSQAFAKHDIKSLADLHRLMTQCYTPHPECHHLDKMGAFNALLLPYLPAKGHIDGITKPRCFKIMRSPSGKVVYKYRNQLQTEKKAHSQHTKHKNRSNQSSRPAPNSGNPADSANLEYLVKDDAWMPKESIGYNLFRNGLPDLNDCRLSPYKPIDHPALARMITTLSYHCDTPTLQWWNDLVAQFAAEDAAYVLLS